MPDASAQPATDSDAPPHREPPVGLVTILYKSADSLPGFLAGLERQTFRDWKIYCIDNASPDGSADTFLTWSDVRGTLLRNPRNLGFAKAANQGIRAALAAGSDAVILLNNDVEMGPDFLELFVAAAMEAGADVAAPRIMRADRPAESWYAGGCFDRTWTFKTVHNNHLAGDVEPRQVDFATGCCLLITRAAFERVGLFDERFFVYWEDTDYCMRLKAAGVPLFYLPAASLLHDGGASSGGEFSPSYRNLFYCNYMRLLKKHFGFPHAVRTMARLLAKELGRRPTPFKAIVGAASAMMKGLAT